MLRNKKVECIEFIEREKIIHTVEKIKSAAIFLEIVFLHHVYTIYICMYPVSTTSNHIYKQIRNVVKKHLSYSRSRYYTHTILYVYVYSFFLFFIISNMYMVIYIENSSFWVKTKKIAMKVK